MGSYRVITSLFLAAVAVVMSGTPAAAGREWCATDPILQFADGSLVQWAVQFEPDHLASLTGPVVFSYEVPVNAGPIVVSFPPSAAPETVLITYVGKPWDKDGGTIPVRATVSITSRVDFATVTSVRGNVAKSVDVRGHAHAERTANATVDRTRWSDLLAAGLSAVPVTVTGSGRVDKP